MSTKRKGRGLAAVFETGTAGSDFKEIPLAQIVPNKNQPRKEFEEKKLNELVASIRAVGILQPVVVRKIDENSYELIAGERRFRAANEIGLPAVPAVVRSAVDQNSLEQALAENLHRAELSPLEEAAAYQALIDDFGLTQQDVADRVHKNRATISNTIRLTELPAPIQKMLNEGTLTAGHGRALLAIGSEKKQLEIAKKAVEKNWPVRKLEELAQSTKASKGTGSTTNRSATIVELENLLAEHLNTRVKVQLQANQKGKIQVEFFGLEDLERIYRKIHK